MACRIPQQMSLTSGILSQEACQGVQDHFNLSDNCVAIHGLAIKSEDREFSTILSCALKFNLELIHVGAFSNSRTKMSAVYFQWIG